jgi:hypothetical protein
LLQFCSSKPKKLPIPLSLNKWSDEVASISKRGQYQFQVQIRRKGYPTQQSTFETRKEAEAWAAVIESEMTRGVFTDRSELERTTLAELLERYGREVTPGKRGWRAEASRLRIIGKHALAIRKLV